MITSVRWMVRRDMNEVLAIEEASFEFPWDADIFWQVSCQRETISMVAEMGRLVVGYVFYELNYNHLFIMNFAVHPDFRRRYVASTMLRKVISKINTTRRTHIDVEVRETNLVAQLCLRQNGFRAIKVLRDHYEETFDDAYLMRYHERDPVTALPLRRAARGRLDF